MREISFLAYEMRDEPRRIQRQYVLELLSYLADSFILCSLQLMDTQAKRNNSPLKKCIAPKMILPLFMHADPELGRKMS